ncbi:hypothetical protein JX265_009488 [Neoarthrinium moseri]|uniref:C2H2-type domain-containing protein n=1 Tax=Neoarthrinium moseri TaxID=1658444 RepID=A0A9P9WG09_9PEZI|nr:hypothetical protein JX265_009488 [Neoarthrinium moseri]
MTQRQDLVDGLCRDGIDQRHPMGTFESVPRVWNVPQPIFPCASYEPDSIQSTLNSRFEDLSFTAAFPWASCEPDFTQFPLNSQIQDLSFTAAFPWASYEPGFTQFPLNSRFEDLSFTAAFPWASCEPDFTQFPLNSQIQDLSFTAASPWASYEPGFTQFPLNSRFEDLSFTAAFPWASYGPGFTQFPLNSQIQNISSATHTQLTENETCVDIAGSIQPQCGNDKDVTVDAAPQSPGSSSRGSRAKRKPRAKRESKPTDGSSPKEKCPHCKIVVAWRSLKFHLLTHTGEKPHQCPWPGCKKMFTQKGNCNERGRVFKQNYEAIEDPGVPHDPGNRLNAPDRGSIGDLQDSGDEQQDQTPQLLADHFIGGHTSVSPRAVKVNKPSQEQALVSVLPPQEDQGEGRGEGGVYDSISKIEIGTILEGGELEMEVHRMSSTGKEYATRCLEADLVREDEEALSEFWNEMPGGRDAAIAGMIPVDV